LVFQFLLHRSGEALGRAREVGLRLGQISEFSLLIAVLALHLGEKSNYQCPPHRAIMNAHGSRVRTAKSFRRFPISIRRSV
jgi:hypothetical protein